ncbi:recombinase family protein [Alkalibacterium indicireducens]
MAAGNPNGDTLVVTKQERFVRNTQDALNTIKYLFEIAVHYFFN